MEGGTIANPDEMIPYHTYEGIYEEVSIPWGSSW